MGLDVYLYHNPELAKAKKALKKRGDNDEFDFDEGATKIEEDSKTDPQHMFKVGYFRSSYNNGGFNQVLHRKGIPDLYDIFDPGDEYYVFPKWQTALKNVNEAIETLERVKNEPNGDLDVVEIQFNPFIPVNELPTDSAQVLTKVKENLKQDHGGFGSYSNRLGFFFPSGIEVVACRVSAVCLARSLVPMWSIAPKRKRARIAMTTTSRRLF